MKKSLVRIIIVVLALGLAVPQFKIDAKVTERTHHHCNWRAIAKFKGEMTNLWIDHVVWTRDYVKSSIAGLEDQEIVLARLLKNQEDLGNAIKPYYGAESGNKFTALLKDHIVIAGKLVEAAKLGDESNFNKLNKQWYKNGDDIVQFLSKANPKYDEKVLKEAWDMHLKLVTDQVTARLKKDWAADIRAFDEGEEHMIEFADTLTRGIKKQFPDKFQCRK